MQQLMKALILHPSFRIRTSMKFSSWKARFQSHPFWGLFLRNIYNTVIFQKILQVFWFYVILRCIANFSKYLEFWCNLFIFRSLVFLRALKQFMNALILNSFSSIFIMCKLGTKVKNSLFHLALGQFLINLRWSHFTLMLQVFQFDVNFGWAEVSSKNLLLWGQLGRIYISLLQVGFAAFHKSLDSRFTLQHS